MENGTPVYGPSAYVYVYEKAITFEFMVFGDGGWCSCVYTWINLFTHGCRRTRSLITINTVSCVARFQIVGRAVDNQVNCTHVIAESTPCNLRSVRSRVPRY